MSIASAMANPQAPVQSVVDRVDAIHVASLERVAVVGICALILISPFETLEPLVRLPGQALSSVELPLLLVVAAWLAAVWWSGDRAWWRSTLTVPWIAVVVVSLLASLLASADRINGLHMTARLLLALAVFLVALSAARSRLGAMAITRSIVAAGVLISALIIAESIGVPPIIDGLRAFRTNAAVVGGQLRASGPLQYPTIASMFLEVAFALGLGLLPAAVDRRRTGPALAIVAALIVIGEGITLTFTRSGLLTLGISLLVVAGWRVARSGIDRVVFAIAGVAVMVGAETLLVRPLESMRLRFSSETQEYWFRAEFDAPLSIALRTGDVTRVPVRVTNTGRVTWSSQADHPFRLAYHWLELDGDRVVQWEGERTEFPGAVPPGATVALEARVRAPRAPGTFLLNWDIEQLHQLWFGTEPDAVLAATRASVTGPIVSGPPIASGQRVPRSTARPGRLVLWRAAVRMFAAAPLLGLGPDNFRLQYGSHAGIMNADRRVHSNNMYLEILVGSGLVGAAAWLWFGWRAGRQFVGRALGHDAMPGVTAAGCAIAIHGLVDSFLAFTATYILFATCAALAASPGEGHARRV